MDDPAPRSENRMDGLKGGRPIREFWWLFLALAAFVGDGVYNLYCVVAYGEILGSRIGSGWITFAARPYSFSFALLIYLTMTLLFGAGIIKVIYYLYLRWRFARR